MRIFVIAASLIAVLGVGGWFAWQDFKVYLPGIIGRIQNPIQPNQPVVWAQGPETAPEGARPPNIIVIMADDLGWNDVSLHGGVADGLVQTPAIDSIARDGAYFPKGYAAHATCSPSRAALMSGRYPSRIGFEFTSAPVLFARNIYETARREQTVPPVWHEERVKDMPPRETLGLPAQTITLAEALKPAGYHNIHIGKWHLGESPDLRAEAQGFDESLGFHQGAAMFLPERHPDVVNSKQDFDPIDEFLWKNLPYAVRFNGSRPFNPDAYMTDYFAREAVRAIEANRNRPFFMFLAFNAPHTPLQALRSDYDALSGIENERLRVYGAMIRALDRGVGQVLEALRANGLEENTLVVFTSDNGGAHYVGLPEINAPLRGWKATFFEGGIRTPFFVKWPARIPAGTVAASRAMHVDVYATALAAAGAAVPEGVSLDGVDLVAAATGQGPGRDAVFHTAGGYRSVIAGDWKLQIEDRRERVWLFDITNDPSERNNLAASRPDKVAELRLLLEQHAAGRGPELWPALIEAAIPVDKTLEQGFGPDDEYVYWPN